MKIKAWAILTTGLADGYELTKSPARVQAARENGQTVVELDCRLPHHGYVGGLMTDKSVRLVFKDASAADAWFEKFTDSIDRNMETQ